MSLFSIDMECQSCGIVWDTLVERSSADQATEPCPVNCGGAGRRCLSIPNGLRVSTPMGVSGKGGAYKELKQISKLKVDRANLPEQKRGEINAEIQSRQRAADRASIGAGSNKPLPSEKGKKK